MKTQHVDNGFTLIEVLIAIMVLTIGILALYSMQIRAVQSNSTADRLTNASAWNTNQIEQRISLQYTNASLRDTDGDGTGQDTSAPLNGLDNDGGNFGLDDALCCPGGNDAAGKAVAVCGAPQQADGCAMSENYTIYWNVAVDVPLPNTKTIRVMVQDSQRTLARPVTFTYIKDDII